MRINLLQNCQEHILHNPGAYNTPDNWFDLKWHEKRLIVDGIISKLSPTELIFLIGEVLEIPKECDCKCNKTSNYWGQP